MVHFLESVIRLTVFMLDRMSSGGPKSELRSDNGSIYYNENAASEWTVALGENVSSTLSPKLDRQLGPPGQGDIPCPNLLLTSGPFVEFPLPEMCTSSVPPGTRCNMGCSNPNFELVGSCSRVCYGNGQWSGFPTQCINRNVRCPPLTSILNRPPTGPGRRKRRKRQSTVPATLEDPLACLPFAGSVCQFTCPQGTIATSNPTVACLENGQWNSRELMHFTFLLFLLFLSSYIAFVLEETKVLLSTSFSFNLPWAIN